MLSCFSHVLLFVTPCTVAHQTPPSMGFYRQEYWWGLSCPPPGDFPTPGIKPTSLKSPTLAGGFFITSSTWEAQKSEESWLYTWGKPKNTRVGRLSLLQGIFQSRESNWGLLHCKHILYQLSYQESP